MSPQLTEQNIKHNTRLLVLASKNGVAAKVKRLIPLSEPKTNDSSALLQAA